MASDVVKQIIDVTDPFGDKGEVCEMVKGLGSTTKKKLGIVQDGICRYSASGEMRPQSNDSIVAACKARGVEISEISFGAGSTVFVQGLRVADVYRSVEQ